ncbi:unnamed protein product [Caenorhabditis bovis]|uniref:Uncharacterized protein n=1 Tax=Caenorhabditis bovis TaxID=2654633 RepID=A0A8S1EUQ4_9PELO|nr:unnamed protein product [Caenorhabditis bovis]
MAFGGLLDNFLQEKSRGLVNDGSAHKSSMFYQHRQESYSMYQNYGMATKKMSTISMVNPKMSTISIDVYPKYSLSARSPR